MILSCFVTCHVWLFHLVSHRKQVIGFDVCLHRLRLELMVEHLQDAGGKTVAPVPANL